jgi:hypothetical protein
LEVKLDVKTENVNLDKNIVEDFNKNLEENLKERTVIIHSKSVVFTKHSMKNATNIQRGDEIIYEDNSYIVTKKERLETSEYEDLLFYENSDEYLLNLRKHNKTYLHRPIKNPIRRNLSKKDAFLMYFPIILSYDNDFISKFKKIIKFNRKIYDEAKSATNISSYFYRILPVKILSYDDIRCFLHAILINNYTATYRNRKRDLKITFRDKSLKKLEIFKNFLQSIGITSVVLPVLKRKAKNELRIKNAELLSLFFDMDPEKKHYTELQIKKSTIKKEILLKKREPEIKILYHSKKKGKNLEIFYKITVLTDKNYIIVDGIKHFLGDDLEYKNYKLKKKEL